MCGIIRSEWELKAPKLRCSHGILRCGNSKQSVYVCCIQLSRQTNRSHRFRCDFVSSVCGDFSNMRQHLVEVVVGCRGIQTSVISVSTEVGSTTSSAGPQLPSKTVAPARWRVATQARDSMPRSSWTVGRHIGSAASIDRTTASSEH